ncbi:MAG: hypothetical protein ACXVE4_08815, partial [Solirubrobacteraceae bacterium]
VREPFIGPGALAPSAGGSPEADEENGAHVPLAAPRASIAAAGAAPAVTAVAVLFAAASVVFGIFPQPLFDLAAHAGRALGLG